MRRAFLVAPLACLVLLTGCGYHTAFGCASAQDGSVRWRFRSFRTHAVVSHRSGFYAAGDSRVFQPHALQAGGGQRSGRGCDSGGTVTSYQVVTPDLQLADRAVVELSGHDPGEGGPTDRNHKILYQNSSYLFRQQYETTQDLVSFIQEDPAAVQRISQDFARAVVSDILESF